MSKFDLTPLQTDRLEGKTPELPSTDLRANFRGPLALDIEPSVANLSTLELFDVLEGNLQVLRELQGRVSFLGREIRYLLKVRD